MLCKRICVLRVAAIAAMLASFLSGEAKTEPDFLTDRIGWYKAQIRCMRDAVFTEARGESDFGQLMVAWVVAQRALDNSLHFGGGTICKVVYATKRDKKGRIISQFSGPVHNPVRVSDDDPVLVRAEYNARRVLMGGWEPEGELRLVRYYQQPERADPKRSVWFQTLKAVEKVGNHIFYREHNKSPG